MTMTTTHREQTSLDIIVYLRRQFGQLIVKTVRCRYSCCPAALLREGPRFAVDLGGTPVSRARPRIAPDLTVGMSTNLVEVDSN